jgi:hypothetical protein
MCDWTGLYNSTSVDEAVTALTATVQNVMDELPALVL